LTCGRGPGRVAPSPLRHWAAPEPQIRPADLPGLVAALASAYVLRIALDRLAHPVVAVLEASAGRIASNDALTIDAGARVGAASTTAKELIVPAADVVGGHAITVVQAMRLVRRAALLGVHAPAAGHAAGVGSARVLEARFPGIAALVLVRALPRGRAAHSTFALRTGCAAGSVTQRPGRTFAHIGGRIAGLIGGAVRAFLTAVIELTARLASAARIAAGVVDARLVI